MIASVAAALGKEPAVTAPPYPCDAFLIHREFRIPTLLFGPKGAMDTSSVPVLWRAALLPKRDCGPFWQRIVLKISPRQCSERQLQSELNNPGLGRAIGIGR